MSLRMLATYLLVCSVCVVSSAQDVGLAGVWATDAVKTAIQAKDNRETREFSDGFRPNGLIVIEKGASPDGAALVLELKVDGTKVSGKVTEFVNGTQFEIEEFSGSGSTFGFTTYKTVGSVKVATTYRGQRLDDGTIAIERLTPSGKRIDTKADGTPNTLIFRRSTVPLPPQIDIPTSFIQGFIGGDLTVEGAGLIPRMRLRLVRADGTSADPRFVELRSNLSSSISAGLYTVEVQPPEGFAFPKGYFVKSMTAGATDLLKEPLMIDGSSRVRVAVILGVTSPSWAQVTGKVTGLDSAAKKPDLIVLASPLVGEAITAPIESDGAFTIPMALPGVYQVRFMPLLDSFSRTITVGTAETNVVTVPLVIPTVSISGRVTGLAALSAGSVYEARLHPPSEPRMSVIRSPAHLVVPINSDGTFFFKTIPAGNYQLIISSCQYVGTGPPTTPGAAGGGAGAAGCRTRTTTAVVTVTDKDITDLDVAY